MLAPPWRSDLTSVPVQDQPGLERVLDQVIVPRAPVLRGVAVGRRMRRTSCRQLS